MTELKMRVLTQNDNTMLSSKHLGILFYQISLPISNRDSLQSYKLSELEEELVCVAEGSMHNITEQYRFKGKD